MQQALFHESIQDALREVIRAAGGSKIVGCELWPSQDLSLACTWMYEKSGQPSYRR
jgi:hypothetical protein